MAWNPSPDVAVARDWAKKHGYDYVLMVGMKKDSETYKIVTYGKDKPMCDEAYRMGVRLENLMDEIYALDED